MSMGDLSLHGLIGGGGIKRIQRGEILFGNNTEETISIEAIDPTKSIILVSVGNWNHECQNVDNSAEVAAEILSSTQIRCRRSLPNATYSIVCYWTVVEFNSGVIKSIQKGSITPVGSSVITVNAVVPEKALLLYSATRTVASAYVPSAYLYNATTIRASSGYVFERSQTIYYQLVEFY